MKKFLILGFGLIILFSLHGPSYPQDPFEPDTVKFGEWCGYTVGPPYSGKLAVPVIFVNDEVIIGFAIPLSWTGPLLLDTAYFVGSRVDFRDFTAVLIDNVNKKACVGWVGITESMPPGTGPILSLNFSIMDTGLVSIDTSTYEYSPCEFGFTDPLATTWIPQFMKGEFHIVPSDILPGDLDKNGEIDLADVIFLAYYLLMGGDPPECFPFADVNSDCKIDLADVIYLASWCFGTGPAPVLGCAW